SRLLTSFPTRRSSDLPTENVSCAPHYPGHSLSNSPWASFSTLAFSNAASWASVRTWLSRATLASSARNRLLRFSSPFRSHTHRRSEEHTSELQSRFDL